MPCALPDADSLGALLRDASVVVRARIDAAGTSESLPEQGSVTRYSARLDSVLYGNDPGSVIAIVEAGGVPVPLLQPGRYILALSSTGDSTYAVVGGYEGRLALDGDSRLHRRCVNYDDPGNPKQPDGDPTLTEQEFRGRLAQAPRPTRRPGAGGPNN